VVWFINPVTYRDSVLLQHLAGDADVSKMVEELGIIDDG
jgi:hypothetical protein